MRRLVVSVAAALTLLAACSSDSGDDSQETADPQEESAETTTVDAAEETSEATPAPDADDSADDAEADHATPTPAVEVFMFTVEGVTGGDLVPVEYTCDGANAVPTVTIEGVPSTVAELALVVDDPDAPTESPFVHWLVYGISPDTTSIGDGDPAFTYGTNDAGSTAWLGPCPPPGDGLHAYRWKLFGLSEPLGLEPGLDGRALEEAIAPSVVHEALITASYERPG